MAPLKNNYFLDYLIKKAADPAMGGMPPGGMPPGGMPPMDPSMMGGMPPMDPSMMAGGMPPMDPSMMGGMPPMDPSMMGGMPPMDPSMMAGGMPAPAAPPAAPPADPATAAGAEAKASSKIKTEQWMAHIDSYCYNMLTLMLELFDQLNLKTPTEALLQRPLEQAGPSAEELSKMMADSIGASSGGGTGGGSPADALSAASGAPPMEAPKTASYNRRGTDEDDSFTLNQLITLSKLHMLD